MGKTLVSIRVALRGAPTQIEGEKQESGRWSCSTSTMSNLEQRKKSLRRQLA